MPSKAIKKSAKVDFLADQIVENYEPIKFDFPIEDLLAIMQVEEEFVEENSWKLYFGSASNALKHDINAILITLEGEYCSFTARLDFNCINNVAEYEACTIGLHAAMDKGVKKLKVYGNPTLVIYQLREEWKTKDSWLIFYHKHIIEIINKFEEIDFNHLPFQENQMADALATLDVMFQVNSSDEIQPIRMRL